MVTKPRTRIALALCASALAFAGSPAQAAVGFVPTGASPTAILTRSLGDCAGAARTVAGLAPASAAAGGGASKSAAILGGQRSALDAISAAQDGSAALAPALPAATGAVSALPGSGACTGFVQPRSVIDRPSASASGLAFPDARPGGGDFLGSHLVSLNRTPFDAAWGRVEHAGLARARVEAVSGIGAAANGGADEATVARVNAWANHAIRYVDDIKQYGKADYWASAGETLASRAGDCEDIAIVKLQALAALGVPRSAMFLTVARDQVRHADHALLIVRLGGKSLLLDNATDRLLDARQANDYAPVLTYGAAGSFINGY